MFETEKLPGQVAVITGGTTGIDLAPSSGELPCSASVQT